MYICVSLSLRSFVVFVISVYFIFTIVSLSCPPIFTSLFCHWLAFSPVSVAMETVLPHEREREE